MTDEEMATLDLVIRMAALEMAVTLGASQEGSYRVVEAARLFEQYLMGDDE